MDALGATQGCSKIFQHANEGRGSTLLISRLLALRHESQPSHSCDILVWESQEHRELENRRRETNNKVVNCQQTSYAQNVRPAVELLMSCYFQKTVCLSAYEWCEETVGDGDVTRSVCFLLLLFKSHSDFLKHKSFQQTVSDFSGRVEKLHRN